MDAGKTDLMKMAENGDIEAIKRIIVHGRIWVCWIFALHLASILGKTNCVEILLRFGAK